MFVCGVCGAKIYSYGKKNGSFRCSAATSGKCWNRVYCMRERTEQVVLEAVVNEVLSLEGCREAVLARVRELHANGGAIAAELKRLEKQEQRLVGAIDRLAVAVESGDGSLSSLTARLADRERELAIVRAERQELEEQARARKKLPSKATLLEHLETVKGQLLEDETRATVILRQLLDGPIKVVPYMRVDGKRVVPRLEFTINLVAAFPAEVSGPLGIDTVAGNEPPALLQRQLLVNAFFEPHLVKHTAYILNRRAAGVTYKVIAKEIDLTEEHMENIAKILRMMEEQGLSEPYWRVTEKPAHVPRWCSKHWLKPGERKTGGKRRKAS